MANFKSDVLIGFFLALLTAIIWGTVPIALREVVMGMEVTTIVWYRFLISFMGLFIIMSVKKMLPRKSEFLSLRVFVLIVLATIALSGNFILYSSALKYVTPTVTQFVAQLSSVGLLYGGVLIFKEKLTQSQLIGSVILMIGFGLFFNSSLIELFTQLTAYSKGVFLTASASFVWVIYALVQKIILKQLRAQQVLLLLYFGCIVVLFPFAHMNEIFALSWIQLVLLIYCGLSTLVSYGALAEAMHRWQVSQVSAIITLTPLFTLFFSDLLALLWPDYFDLPKLNLLGYMGAFIFVFGAMFTAIGNHIMSMLYKTRARSFRMISKD